MCNAYSEILIGYKVVTIHSLNNVSLAMVEVFRWAKSSHALFMETGIKTWWKQKMCQRK